MVISAVTFVDLVSGRAWRLQLWYQDNPTAGVPALKSRRFPSRSIRRDEVVVSSTTWVVREQLVTDGSRAVSVAISAGQMVIHD